MEVLSGRAPSSWSAHPCHRSVLLVLVLAGGLFPLAARAQSLEDLELRKGVRSDKVAFGAIGLLEGNGSINQDRPTGQIYLYLAPQLKIGEAMRLQLNMSGNFDLLNRQENQGFYLEDWSLEFAHLKIVREKVSGFTLSGRVRYYLPISKASLDANSCGQLRGYVKLSVSPWRLYFSAEVNGQKYFNRYTTWKTSESPGSETWFHQAGRDEYVENNTDYGFGQTYTGAITIVDGLDFSLIWGMYQSRKYQSSKDHGDVSGSSYLQESRKTGWEHFFRFVADLTLNLGVIPGAHRAKPVSPSPAATGANEKAPSPAPSADKGSWLDHWYLSVGYNILAPQLQNEGRTRSLNPFNAKYGQIYVDLAVMY